MIKTIENVLEEYSDMQLNLSSGVARTWIAKKVAEAVAQHQEITKDLTQIVPELNIDDCIVSAMENNGYTKGDSGYEMETGKRDIIFHTKDGHKFEVTFRRIWNT